MKTIFLFVAILFCFSCSKSLQQDLALSSTAREKPQAINGQKASPDPSNPKNPYDHMGITHNKIIWALLRVVHGTGDTSRQFRRSFVINYGKRLHGIDARNAIEKVEKKLRNCNYDLENLLKNENISSDCRQDIIGLSTILKKLSTGYSYESVRDEIIDLEGKIASKPYSQKERMVFFIAASIARHSAYIWNPVTAMPQRFFLIDWGVAVLEYFANAHTDFLAAVGGALMGLSIDEIDIMTAEESEGAVNFIDGYWG